DENEDVFLSGEVGDQLGSRSGGWCERPVGEARRGRDVAGVVAVLDMDDQLVAVDPAVFRRRVGVVEVRFSADGSLEAFHRGFAFLRFARPYLAGRRLDTFFESSRNEEMRSYAGDCE